MKIILCILSRNNTILQIENTINKMSADKCSVILMDCYERQCGWLSRVAYRCGYRGKKRKYNEKRKKRLINNIAGADAVLFVNLPDSAFSNDDILDIRLACNENNCRMITWIIDPLKGNVSLLPFIKCFDDVFSYEYDDVKWMNEYGILAQYCPVGYQNAYDVGMDENIEKDIDVLFVGTPYKNRLRILEYLAESQTAKNWKLKFIGPFYKYWWKRVLFKIKHPILYKYVENAYLTGDEIVAAYRRSNICLNIHTENATSLNPRSYEIMATKSFELVDARKNYDEFIEGKDLICFNDCDEMIKLIKYYLFNKEQLRCIADNGYKKVKKNRKMVDSLSFVLRNFIKRRLDEI